MAAVSDVDRTVPVGNPGSSPNAIGIYFFSADDSALINSTITQVDGSAVQVISNSSDVLIDGNQMLGDPVTPLNGIRDGVLTQDSQNVTITNNIMRDGFRSGIISTGTGQTDTLIQNCEITGWVAAGVQIENEASLQVIRQNFIARCNTYITGGGGESGIWLDDCNRCLVEGNTVTECDTGLRNSANGVGSSVLANVDNIFRGNLVFNNNANVSGLLNGDEDSLGTRHSVRGFYYHNTFDANGNSSTQGFNGIAMRIHTFGTPSSDNFFVNNIVSNILPNTAGTARTVKFDLAGAEFSKLDGNVYFNGPPNAYELGGGLHPTFAGYQAALLGLGHEQNSVEADPLLDANYVPQAGGAAFGNAVDLVQITSVAGTTIGLDYPGVFWVGDFIEFADGSTAEITAVNATSIEVDAVPASVAAGQGATLFTCNGSDDVGAIQVP